MTDERKRYVDSGMGDEFATWEADVSDGGPLWTGDYIYFLGEGALPLVGPPATCSWSCCVYTENRTPPLWKLPTGVPLGPSEITCGYSPPVPPSGCCLKLSQAMDDVTYQWLLSSAQR